jgi:hypothetical protein
MQKIKMLIWIVTWMMLQSAPLAAENHQAEIRSMKGEIETLRHQLEAQRQVYESQIRTLEEKIEAIADRLTEGQAVSDEAALSAEVHKANGQTAPEAPAKGTSAVAGVLQRMNPDMSVIGDMNYHNSEAGPGVGEIFERMAGFGHAHEEEGGHEHGVVEEGFNVREVELWLSGEVDPYFKAYTTIAVSEEGAELEEIVVRTAGLPLGFELLGGKFLSRFGRINSQHPHEWDFIDRPLIYALSFGDHGLLEKGVQLSWLAPTPFYLLFGLEAFQGKNEKTFNTVGGDYLPDKDGPRTWVGWLKYSPNLPQNHGVQAGLFGGFGDHQEAHTGEEEEADHYLNGTSSFCGADIVYKYDTGKAYGHGDFITQAEYFYRKQDLDIDYHAGNPDLIGRNRENRQDGYYVQALYGIFPRWRMGARWEELGLTNEIDLPDGSELNFDESYRWTGMLDFSPTEFSRLRLQVNKGDYVLEDRHEDFWQIYLQLLISIGTHGAHNF